MADMARNNSFCSGNICSKIQGKWSNDKQWISVKMFGFSSDSMCKSDCAEIESNGSFSYNMFKYGSDEYASCGFSGDSICK